MFGVKKTIKDLEKRIEVLEGEKYDEMFTELLKKVKESSFVEITRYDSYENAIITKLDKDIVIKIHEHNEDPEIFIVSTFSDFKKIAKKYTFSKFK